MVASGIVPVSSYSRRATPFGAIAKVWATRASVSESWAVALGGVAAASPAITVTTANAPMVRRISRAS